MRNNITINEEKMLRLIRICGPMNIYKISHGLAISKQDAITAINSLISKGLVNEVIRLSNREGRRRMVAPIIQKSLG